MKIIFSVFPFLFLFTLLVKAEYWDSEEKRETYINYVWDHRLKNFSEESYAEAIKKLFDNFEALTGQKLNPGEKRRVGVKISAHGGMGISSPKPLVRAVVLALQSRGFKADEIFLIDVNERALRAAKYIAPLSQRKEKHSFNTTPVLILDSGDYYDPEWVYESPLPDPWQKQKVFNGIQSDFTLENQKTNRKSFLPKILINEVDFWINLPVVTDHPALGVKGALANATLWNISNRERFFISRTNAPLAAAEIAAIPELLLSWALTVMPLEYYQFIGGPDFNARYTESEKRLWMSVNPVILDALILKKMNAARRSESFRPIKNTSVFPYAENVGVGTADINSIKWIRLQ